MEVLNKYKTTDTDCVSIMRGSPLGNPFIIGTHGTRDEVIELHDQWLKYKIFERDQTILTALSNLTNESKLLCCCKPKPCHGDSIIKYWEKITELGGFNVGLEEFIEQEQPVIEYSPTNDGIDHINIYSRGVTKLGRALSNFARSPFIHSEYGEFESMEGFWYWIATNKKHDILRSLYGYQAKKVGMSFKRVEIEGFDSMMIEAIKMKIDQNKALRQAVYNSTLPFTHYYHYGDMNNCKVIRTKSGDWLAEVLEGIRKELKW